MFLSRLLLNAETWHNLSQTNIDELEASDKNLLRRILNVPDSTPILGLYLELGIVPIRFFIQAKRLVYFQELLKRSSDEMTNKMLKAQQKKPTKGDWYSTAQNDLQQFNINYSNEEITKMKKKKWKREIKKSMIKAAFEYLIAEKNRKEGSKMKNLNYNELKIQKYLLSKEMSTKTKIMLFKARNRMLKVASNYGSKTNCPLCKISEDSQKHLLECVIIKITCQDILNNDNKKYEDIYSDNVTKQKEIIQLIEIAIRKREEIIEMNENEN